MRSPVRSLPPNVGRWASRARWLRWLDALAAWLLVWGGLALTPYAKTPGATAVAAAVLVGLAALVSPIRRRWRPLGALILLSVSRALRPGDRAWLVLPQHVEPVIVTARRRLRLVVARPDQDLAEGLEVRRTRVLVVPASG
ncbi:MAG: hypothetical protein DME03_07830 [Candidatus Rokuibacteriota bacterium]|nr:MAG: hypothetical protein DME03_07830 [Candidatus Rokubacteria bacterium]